MAIINLVGVYLLSSFNRLMLFLSVLGRDLLLDLCWFACFSSYLSTLLCFLTLYTFLE